MVSPAQLVSDENRAEFFYHHVGGEHLQVARSDPGSATLTLGLYTHQLSRTAVNIHRYVCKPIYK